MTHSQLILYPIGAVAAAEIAVHAYLDVMYKETIPKGIFKIIQEKTDNGDLIPLSNMCEESMKWVDAQDVETVTMQSDRGETLKGFLLMAEEKTDKFCLFAHGYRASHRGDSANFFKFYHDKGFNYLAVDHTAAGESEGDWVGFDYYESIDMLKWLDYIIDRYGSDIEIVIHGVSMGGATVCQMADKIPPQVKAIVADCPYTSAKDEFICVANSVGVKKTAPYILGAMNFLNKRLAGYDLELFLDLGCKSAEEAANFVTPGDSFCYHSEWTTLGNGKVACKAIDDRFGCAAMLCLLSGEIAYDTWFAFFVQEEIGLRGSGCAAYAINPDFAIILETTTAADLDGVTGDAAVCRLGGGPVVSFMDRRTIYDKELYQLGFSAARELGIPCQTKTRIAGGNDAGAVHITREGVRTMAISIPCRCLHSPYCVAQVSDMEQSLLLAGAMLSKIQEL